jgi:hypothetical protein
MGTLYKFRTFSDPHHHRLLTENEVWFSAPTQFNDPFDCNIPLRFDKCPEDWLLERMAKYALSKNPEISIEEARKIAEEELEKTGPEERRALRRHQFKQSVSPVTGVLSLSSHWNQNGAELLWSHYAAKHTGFVVGFNEEVMLSWMRELSGAPEDAERQEASEGLDVRPTSVEYVNEMPSLVPCEESEVDLIHKLVTHKSEAWSYEDEVRYLMFNFDSDLKSIHLSDDNRAQKIPGEAIDEVTLGVNVSVSDAERTEEILREKDTEVGLYWARLKENEFGMERTPLEL